MCQEGKLAKMDTLFVPLAVNLLSPSFLIALYAKKNLNKIKGTCSNPSQIIKSFLEFEWWFMPTSTFRNASTTHCEHKYKSKYGIN